MQIVTKLKISICEETKKLFVTKLKNSNLDQTQKTEIVTQLKKKKNCDKTQKLKL